MRGEMAVLIDGIVMRSRGIVDTILLYGYEVRIPVVQHIIAGERRDIVVVGRVRIGIEAVVGIVALSPHDTFRSPIGQRPDLVLGLIVRVCAIGRLIGVIEKGVPGIDGTDLRAGVRGVAGGPDTIDDEGMIPSIDSDADRVVVGNGVLTEIGSEVVGGGGTAGAINPVVEPVGL